MSTEAAATNPVMTEFETKLTKLPSRSSPSTSITAPERRVTVNNAPGMASSVIPAACSTLPVESAMALVSVDTMSTVPVDSAATNVATSPE